MWRSVFFASAKSVGGKVTAIVLIVPVRTLQDVRDFFGAAATLLRAGGWLYLGYHLNPHAPRGRPRSQSHA